MNARLVLVMPILLAACVPSPPDTGPALEDACKASQLQNLVGQNARVLETVRFGQTTRIVRPGMAVTMDFVASRLNIWIAEGAVIERVTCG